MQLCTSLLNAVRGAGHGGGGGGGRSLAGELLLYKNRIPSHSCHRVSNCRPFKVAAGGMLRVMHHLLRGFYLFCESGMKEPCGYF